MKKLVAVVLLLALITPVAALAMSEADVPGCYVYYDLLKSGAPQMTMFYLAPNYSCYYLIQSYHEDEPGIGRSYVGYWEVQGDGTIYAKTGNNTDMVLIISEDASVAYDKKLNQYFINISKFDQYVKVK